MQTLTAFIPYDIYDRREDPVFIEVKIGHGQQASTVLMLDSNQIGKRKGSFKREIGKNKELKGRTLNLFSTIQDIMPDTNRISMEIELTGGKITHDQVIVDTTVTKEGAIVTAVVTVIFF